MPAAAVTPAPLVYFDVIAVKKLVVEFLWGWSFAPARTSPHPLWNWEYYLVSGSGN